MKTLVQCDFDNTITDGDVSFQILENFGDGSWRGKLDLYRQGDITVGQFNSQAFAGVKESKRNLIEFVRRHAIVRPGLQDMMDCCRRKNFEFVIVSNGLDFYIKSILKDAGLDGVKVYSARTRFLPTGIDAHYINLDGKELLSGFKESFTRHFLEQDFRVIYIGDGLSDIGPAKMADDVIARGDLLRLCREQNVQCHPFDTLTDVARILENS